MEPEKNSNERRSKRTSVALLALAVAGGFFVGVALRSEPVARAEVRKATPQATFPSGSERSLPLLAEMGTTLKRIDARLARIEAMLRDTVEPGRVAP